MPRAKKTKPTPRSHRREGSRLVNLWLTEEERAHMVAAAGRAGLGIGPWLRSLGLREARRSTPQG